MTLPQVHYNLTKPALQDWQGDGHDDDDHGDEKADEGGEVKIEGDHLQW